MTLRLPVGFVAFDNGRFRVIAPRLSLDELTALLTGPKRDAGVADPNGRGGARRIVLPGGKPVFCRRYLRGGCMRWLTRDLFLMRPERPLRELVVCEAARAAGCSVPAMLACAIEEVGPFYRGWIVTEAIDDSTPLIEVLARTAKDHPARVLDAVRGVIDELHDAGIDHVDLTGHNVLMSRRGRPVVIDFDRATLGRPLGARKRDKAFARLRRSLKKLCVSHGVELAPEAWRSLEPRVRSSASGCSRIG